MKSIIIFLLAICAIPAIAEAGNRYTLDESAIELAFDYSEDVAYLVFGGAEVSPFTGMKMESIASAGMDKQQLAAIVAVVEYLTGVGILIPIHRLILGCDGQGVKVVALYCVTLGGLGWLPIVDAIFLFLDDSDSAYINNGKFLMWLDELKK